MSAKWGNAACGDALKLTFKLDKEGRIEDVKFKTFGCASAIASSSALTEIIKGKTLDEAAGSPIRISPEVLGGLPEAKMHCSVMGMEALQAAISHYRGEKSPFEKDEDHEGRIVCKCFGVTDVKILKVAKENQLHKAEDVTHYCKAAAPAARASTTSSSCWTTCGNWRLPRNDEYRRVASGGR